MMLPSAVAPSAPPNIVAIYTGVIADSAAGTVDGDMRASHIVRWELQNDQRILHPIFSQLKSNKDVVPHPTNNVSVKYTVPFVIDISQNMFNAALLEGADTLSIIIAAQPIKHNTVLAFVGSDGTVDFRDRNTMQALQNEQSSDVLSSLMQIGYAFPASNAGKSSSLKKEVRLINTGIHFALSPNACTLAVADEKGELEMQWMQHLAQDVDDMDTRSTLWVPALRSLPLTSSVYEDEQAAMIAASLATSIAQVQSFDDLIAFTNRKLPMGKSKLYTLAPQSNIGWKDHVPQVLEGVFSIFKIELSLPEENDIEKIIKNAVLPKCVGIQQGLMGSKGMAASACTTMPWMIANLRQAIIVFRIAIVNPSPPDAGITGSFFYDSHGADQATKVQRQNSLQHY